MNVPADPGHDAEPDSPPVADEEGPSSEDPNRFPADGVVAALDEAPDGRTPSDSNESTENKT